jgi:glucose-1-phosphate adenylyltransferase
MDLVSVDPLLNLYDEHWPIRTHQPNVPPPKFVFAAEEGGQQRVGRALDSIVCQGTIISGGRVERCIVGPRARINSFSQVQDCILFEGVDIGRHARVRRAIIDKNVHIPPHMEVGYDLDRDRANGFSVSPGGVVVIAKTDGIGL